MIFLVLAFLKALKERDKMFVKSMEQISAQHIEAREKSRKVIEENTANTIESTKVMAQMTEVMRSLRAPQLTKKVDPPLHHG